jgi:hypothetical protein
LDKIEEKLDNKPLKQEKPLIKIPELKLGNSLKVNKKSNDSLPPKYTTFHHLAYVARWSLTLIYF